MGHLSELVQCDVLPLDQLIQLLGLEAEFILIKSAHINQINFVSRALTSLSFVLLDSVRSWMVLS